MQRHGFRSLLLGQNSSWCAPQGTAQPGLQDQDVSTPRSVLPSAGQGSTVGSPPSVLGSCVGKEAERWLCCLSCHALFKRSSGVNCPCFKRNPAHHNINAYTEFICTSFWSASGCARGGLDWILGKISSWKGLSSSKMGCLKEVVEPVFLEVFRWV